MNKLQELRKSNGDTQKDLANLLGVSEMTISRWEKEDKLEIKYDYTKKLAEYFGVSVNYLLDIKTKAEYSSFNEQEYQNELKKTSVLASTSGVAYL